MHTHSRHAVIPTPVGNLTLVASDDALTGLYFARHWPRPDASTFGQRVPAGDDPQLASTARQLGEYFAGERTSFNLAIATHGSPFQERVWAILSEVQYGEAATYGDLAQRLGDRSLSRDVGQAVGQNPLSIVVPCHRVIGKDGTLVGYAGGLERKRALLEREGWQVIPRSGRRNFRDLTIGRDAPTGQLPLFAGVGG